MINLFETFNDASQKLQHSLYLADYRHPTIVMDDTGVLPDDVISPYKFFASFMGNCGKSKYCRNY